MELKKSFLTVLYAASLITILHASNISTFAQATAGQWVSLANPGSAVNVMTSSGSALFAGTEGGGVFRSDDEGRSWKASNNGLFAGAKVRAFESVGTALFIGTDKGVYRSNDQGENWTEANVGLTYGIGAATASRSILTLAAVGSVLFAGAGLEEGATGIMTSIYRSEDLGHNWAEVKTGLPAIASCSSLAAGAAGLFAATNAGVFRSANQGQSWTSANFSGAIEVLIIGENVFAARENGIWRSSDQGTSWTQVLVPPSSNYRVLKMAASGTCLYVVGTYTCARYLCSYLQFSPDLGGRWFDTSAPTIPGVGVLFPASRIYARGDKIYAFYAFGMIQVKSGYFSPWIATVSAASYLDRSFASESLAASFGENLAQQTQQAIALPLPTELAGTTVKVKDSAGVERSAPLLFVSPTQVNYQIPPGTASGLVTITITSNGEAIAKGSVIVRQLAPSLFAANADGKGVAAGVVLRVKSDGSSQYEPVAQYDEEKRAFVTRPIDLGPETDRVFLVLFGTGWRHRSSLEKVAVEFDSSKVKASATFAGPQTDFVGLDQVNVLIPRTLVGRGEITVGLMVDELRSDVELMINIK